MKYLVDNEIVAKTLNEIGLTSASGISQFYKTLFNNSFSYLYHGSCYIKDFDEVRNKYGKHLKLNVSLYDIPFKACFRLKNIIINHYPNAPCITNKANLLKTIGEESFLPLTFNLSIKEDKDAFDKFISNEKGKAKFWIYKPEYMYAGKGIQLISPGPETAGITALKDGIIQEYLMNPMLTTELRETIVSPAKLRTESINSASRLSTRGLNAMNPMLTTELRETIISPAKLRTESIVPEVPRKVDFRIMAMMVGDKNPKMFMSPTAIIRTSGYPFVKSFDIPNPEYVHITNNSYQKHTSNYGKYEPNNTIVKVMPDNITNEFKRIIKTVFNASLRPEGSGGIMSLDPSGLRLKNSKFLGKPKCLPFRPFELFGFDFLVLDRPDRPERFEVKLLEVNDNPSMENILNEMLEEAILLSLALLEGGQIKNLKTRHWVSV